MTVSTPAGGDWYIMLYGYTRLQQGDAHGELLGDGEAGSHPVILDR